MGRDESGFQSELGAYQDESTSTTPESADEAPPAGSTERSSTDGVFRVTVKESAQTANPAVADWVGAAGDVFRYETQATAEQHAAALSEEGGAAVSIQAAAPNDPDETDAYLIADPERSVSTPADPAADTWSFDVEANQYGAIGEALLTTPARNPPALTYFIERDLALDEAVRVRVESGELVTDVAMGGESVQLNERTWIPDCVAVAERESTGAVVERYWCEIKTGDGSFERAQTDVMRAKAATPGATVLKIRVDIDELPDSYRVTFERVDDAADNDASDDSGAAQAGNDAEIL